MRAPKLRFPPGTLLQSANGKELYCVIQAYRETQAPSVWIYVLEVRMYKAIPALPSSVDQSMDPDPALQSRVLFEPRRKDRNGIAYPYFQFGSASHMTTPQVMKHLKTVGRLFDATLQRSEKKGEWKIKGDRKLWPVDPVAAKRLDADFKRSGITGNRVRVLILDDKLHTIRTMKDAQK